MGSVALVVKVNVVPLSRNGLCGLLPSMEWFAEAYDAWISIIPCDGPSEVSVTP
jgi:hypothetical protein